MREKMDPNNKFLFSETNFNRFTKIRENSAALDDLIKNPKTKHILLWRGKILFDCSSDTPRLGLISHNNKFWSNLNDISIQHGNFVGFHNNTAIFYHNIPDWNELEVAKLKTTNFSDNSRNPHPLLPKSFVFCELRNLMTLITKSDATVRIAFGLIPIFKLNKSRSPPICLIDSFATKYRNGTNIGEFGISLLSDFVSRTNLRASL